jgi:hypothetical protein
VGVAVQSGELADSKIIESVLLEPTRLREKIVQANDAAVETIVFLYYFPICVSSVTGLVVLFRLFQWLLSRDTKARCFAIKGATYQPW